MDTGGPVQDDAARQGGGKGKKKKKDKIKMSLDEFLSSSKPSGQTKSANWAPTTDPDDEYDTPFKFDRSTLPSAPKAALGPAVDINMIPKDGPFSAHIGNLSYDANEDDLYNFFSKLEIDNLRIITDNGRPRGYAYVDFKTRDALIEALSYHEKEYMGRTIRVDLASSDKNQDNSRGFSRGGDPDRTEGDWRRRDPPTDNGGFSDRDRGGRYGDRDRGFGGDRDRGFGGDRDRGFGDRDRGFGGDRDRGFGDRDRGFGGDRDRGFGGDRDRSFGGDRDRGFGGDRDRGFGGDRDRGFGGDRDRGFGGDRDRGFGGDRDRGFGDRDRGFGGDRDRGFGDRDRGFGGDRDRGFGGDRDRGFGGDRDRGFGDRDRGFGRDRDRDRGFGGDRDRGYGGDRDRGFGGDRDRGYGDRDRGYDRDHGGGYGDRDRNRDRGYGDRDRGYGDRDGRSNRGYGFNRDRDDGRYGSRDNDRYGRRDDYGYQGRRDDDYDRRPSSRDGSADSSDAPRTRPVLKLQPRSVPKSADDNQQSSKSSSIFGGAKPVDTAAKEREIEERLKKESVRDPPRRGDEEDRDRSRQHSGGDGPAPVGRRDSERSRHSEEGSQPDDSRSPASPKVTEAPTPKMVPAPPPKENAWARKIDPSAPVSPPVQSATNASNNAAPVRREAGPPKSAWGGDHKDRGPPRGDGGPRRDRRDQPRVNQDGRGEGGQRSRPVKEKQLPKSIEDMPKYEESNARDFSDQNKFAFLVEDEDGYSNNDEQQES